MVILSLLYPHPDAMREWKQGGEKECLIRSLCYMSLSNINISHGFCGAFNEWAPFLFSHLCHIKELQLLTTETVLVSEKIHWIEVVLSINVIVTCKFSENLSPMIGSSRKYTRGSITNCSSDHS